MRSYINMLSASAALFAAHKDQGFDVQKEIDIISGDLAKGDIASAEKELDGLTPEQRDDTIELGASEADAEAEASDDAQDGMDEDGENAEELDEILTADDAVNG